MTLPRPSNLLHRFAPIKPVPPATKIFIIKNIFFTHYIPIDKNFFLLFFISIFILFDIFFVVKEKFFL